MSAPRPAGSGVDRSGGESSEPSGARPRPAPQTLAQDDGRNASSESPPSLGRTLWTVAGGIAAVHFVLLALVSAGGYWSPDQGAKLLQIETYRLDPFRPYQIPYGARQLDPPFRFYPRSHLYPQPTADGGVQFQWSPLFTRLSWLPYRLFGEPGLVLLPLLAGAAAAALSAALAHAIEPRLASAAGLTVGLASPMVFYSVQFWEHAPAAALALAALVSACRAGSDHRAPAARLAITVACLAGAVLLRLDTVLVAAGLAGSWLILESVEPGGRLSTPGRRRWVAISTAVAVLVALVTLWTLGGGHGDKLQPSWLVVVAKTHQALFSSDDWRHLHASVGWAWFGLRESLSLPPGRFHAVAGMSTLGLALAATLPRGRAGDRLALAGVGLAAAFSLALLGWTWANGIRVRHVHGLVLVAPYLVAIPRFVRLSFAAGRAARLVAWVSASLLAAATALGTVGLDGGMEWGGRYYLVLYPLGVVCALPVLARAWSRASGRWGRLAVATVGAAALGTAVLYEGVGLLEIRRTHQDLAQIRQVIERDEVPVVTDLAWLPGAVPRTFVERPVSVLHESSDFREWARRTRASRARLVFDPRESGLDDWLAAAAPEPVEVERNLLVRGLRIVDLALGPPSSAQGTAGDSENEQ